MNKLRHGSRVEKSVAWNLGVTSFSVTVLKEGKDGEETDVVLM